MNVERLTRNARITVEIACRVQKGESVLIVTEEVSKAPYRDPLAPIAQALAMACADLGARAQLMDIREYLQSPAFARGEVLRPLKAAMESADVVINAVDYIHFSRLLGAGSNAEGAWKSDEFLTADRRWVALQSHGMDAWEITTEEITRIRERALWLLALCRQAETGRITSARGTDFRFGLGEKSRATPVLGIVPLYGEVAITPAQGTESGVFMVDGPTQRNVRPASELDRVPLVIEVQDGEVTRTTGDPEQLARLEAFMHGDTPPARFIDEVGLPTTQVEANDRYWWEDGTHHHDRVHIALGNNVSRNHIVHGSLHMDGEVCQPTVEIDGLVIIRDGAFVDANLPPPYVP